MQNGNQGDAAHGARRVQQQPPAADSPPRRVHRPRGEVRHEALQPRGLQRQGGQRRRADSLRQAVGRGRRVPQGHGRAGELQHAGDDERTGRRRGEADYRGEQHHGRLLWRADQRAAPAGPLCRALPHGEDCGVRGEGRLGLGGDAGGQLQDGPHLDDGRAGDGQPRGAEGGDSQGEGEAGDEHRPVDELRQDHSAGEGGAHSQGPGHCPQRRYQQHCWRRNCKWWWWAEPEEGGRRR